MFEETSGHFRCCFWWMSWLFLTTHMDISNDDNRGKKKNTYLKRHLDISSGVSGDQTGYVS